MGRLGRTGQCNRCCPFFYFRPVTQYIQPWSRSISVRPWRQIQSCQVNSGNFKRRGGETLDLGMWTDGQRHQCFDCSGIRTSDGRATASLFSALSLSVFFAFRCIACEQKWNEQKWRKPNSNSDNAKTLFVVYYEMGEGNFFRDVGLRNVNSTELLHTLQHLSTHRKYSFYSPRRRNCTFAGQSSFVKILPSLRFSVEECHSEMSKVKSTTALTAIDRWEERNCENIFWIVASIFTTISSSFSPSKLKLSAQSHLRIEREVLTFLWDATRTCVGVKIKKITCKL